MGSRLLDQFEPESTTVWSFPARGNWATHSPSYPGNFAPQVPRNVILTYSQPGETVLDPMVGGGTTLVECRLLGRNGIGVDVNPKAVEVSRAALDFDCETDFHQTVWCGDVRRLDTIADNSIDLICTHPPYLNIVRYSGGQIEGDLSNISDPDSFCKEFDAGIREMYRVLKPGRFCAILIGDTRIAQHYVPLSCFVLLRFLHRDFVLKEDIIKVQHHCSSTSRWAAAAQRGRFYLIMHEHLFVFRKPRSGEDLSRIRWSTRPPLPRSIGA